MEGARVRKSGDGRSRKQGRECGAGVVVVGEVGQGDGWCRCWSAWATRWLVPLVKWMHWDSEPTVGVGGVSGVSLLAVTEASHAGREVGSV